LLAATGCRVKDGFLQTDLFPCEGPSDCGEGWGCVRASPYATDFCAERCDSTTCDGVCTRQEDSMGNPLELCLRGCRINEDGTTSECDGEGFSCIRASAERDDGVCYPVNSCNTDTDCPAGTACLSSLAVGVPGDPGVDNYYCVPRPAAGMCPSRSIPIDLGVRGGELCLATCEPTDTRCPPGFGCLEQASLGGPDSFVPCFPGVYGTPCEDDTNCVFGSCQEVGAAGRQCTLTCDEAILLAGGCPGLLSLELFSGLFELECDPSLQGGEGGGLCVTRYDIGFPCTTPESELFVCREGLECRSFNVPMMAPVKLCSRNCATDMDCNRPGERPDNFCLVGVPLGGSSCLPKGDDGSGCSDGNQCRSGVCQANACLGDGGF
jgi:hypothetical protein